MYASEKDHDWPFAAALVTVFMAMCSWLALQHSAVRPEPAALTGSAVAAPSPAADPVHEGLEVPHKEFLATAYSGSGITKSGVLTATGIVAADPKILPIGSIILVEAGPYSGIYTVMDTGGAVKGHKIDIFIPDYEEAVAFGARRVSVRVLRHGWNPQTDLLTVG